MSYDNINIFEEIDMKLFCFRVEVLTKVEYKKLGELTKKIGEGAK